MTGLILCLGTLALALLVWEDRNVKQYRRSFKHVIYVNGIRGKSTVTRLIDAGLRNGGWRVFCKTTGTDPMTIGVDNIQRPLIRRGRANIKEQIKIMRQAAQENAEILVIECMAVDPALQAVSQHRMVCSDIGVITNVRLDHTAEMGPTLDDICDSLSNTIPKGGILYTADTQFFSRIQANAAAIGCRVELAQPTPDLPQIDFPENLALALGVCLELGVPRATALAGMLQYQPDPYALSAFRLSGGAIFINALSANDPQSSRLIYERLQTKTKFSHRKLILLINNRPDRGYRTRHMILLARSLMPTELWLIGASQFASERAFLRALPHAAVKKFHQVSDLPLDQLGEDTMVFAAGNIAGPGRALIERVREEGRPDVL
ncbi:MAG: poly-gamma-glutamate synthase PgsB [Prevotellaceae bacterium]|nr:MAG: poly-gamma-glutamate synthase PgsB [Prevotellaceae bacterium]